MNSNQVAKIVSEDFSELKSNHKKIRYWRHKINTDVVLFFPRRKVVDSICLTRIPVGFHINTGIVHAVKFKCYTESELMQIIIQIHEEK